MAAAAEPRTGLAAIDDMQLAAYLVSHGLDIVEWRPKPNARYMWAMFRLSDEYNRLRLAWPRSPEFMSFQIYNELLAQVKNAEEERKARA